MHSTSLNTHNDSTTTKNATDSIATNNITTQQLVDLIRTSDSLDIDDFIAKKKGEYDSGVASSRIDWQTQLGSISLGNKLDSSLLIDKEAGIRTRGIWSLLVYYDRLLAIKLHACNIVDGKNVLNLSKYDIVSMIIVSSLLGKYQILEFLLSHLSLPDFCDLNNKIGEHYGFLLEKECHSFLNIALSQSNNIRCVKDLLFAGAEINSDTINIAQPEYRFIFYTTTLRDLLTKSHEINPTLFSWLIKEIKGINRENCEFISEFIIHLSKNNGVMKDQPLIYYVRYLDLLESLKSKSNISSIMMTKQLYQLKDEILEIIVKAKTNDETASDYFDTFCDMTKTTPLSIKFDLLVKANEYSDKSHLNWFLESFNFDEAAWKDFIEFQKFPFKYSDIFCHMAKATPFPIKFDLLFNASKHSKYPDKSNFNQLFESFNFDETAWHDFIEFILQKPSFDYFDIFCNILDKTNDLTQLTLFLNACGKKSPNRIALLAFIFDKINHKNNQRIDNLPSYLIPGPENQVKIALFLSYYPTEKVKSAQKTFHTNYKVFTIFFKLLDILIYLIERTERSYNDNEKKLRSDPNLLKADKLLKTRFDHTKGFLVSAQKANSLCEFVSDQIEKKVLKNTVIGAKDYATLFDNLFNEIRQVANAQSKNALALFQQYLKYRSQQNLCLSERLVFDSILPKKITSLNELIPFMLNGDHDAILDAIRENPALKVIQNEDGDTLLLLLIKYVDFEIFQHKLLDQVSLPATNWKQNNQGFTPISYAVQHKRWGYLCYVAIYKEGDHFENHQKEYCDIIRLAIEGSNFTSEPTLFLPYYNYLLQLLNMKNINDYVNFNWPDLQLQGIPYYLLPYALENFPAKLLRDFLQVLSDNELTRHLVADNGKILGRICDKSDGYDLELMSQLPNGDLNKAVANKIYLSSDGTYIVCNRKGMVRTASLKDSGIDLSDLPNRLNDAALKKRILEVTSKTGYTQSDNDALEKLLLIYSKISSPEMGNLMLPISQCVAANILICLFRIHDYWVVSIHKDKDNHHKIRYSYYFELMEDLTNARENVREVLQLNFNILTYAGMTPSKNKYTRYMSDLLYAFSNADDHDPSQANVAFKQAWELFKRFQEDRLANSKYPLEKTMLQNIKANESKKRPVVSIISIFPNIKTLPEMKSKLVEKYVKRSINFINTHTPSQIAKDSDYVFINCCHMHAYFVERVSKGKDRDCVTRYNSWLNLCKQFETATTTSFYEILQAHYKQMKSVVSGTPKEYAKHIEALLEAAKDNNAAFKEGWEMFKEYTAYRGEKSVSEHEAIVLSNKALPEPPAEKELKFFNRIKPSDRGANFNYNKYDPSDEHKNTL